MQPVMTYEEYYMQYFLLYDDDLSEASFRSVGKMGSETRAGPGSLKLKTGFSDITSKTNVHLN